MAVTTDDLACDDLYLHSREHTGSTHPFQCKDCGFKFDRHSQLKYHVDKKHNNVVKFKCDICDKGFYKESDLRSHLDVHTGTKKHNCDICSKSFGHISNLN